MTATKAPAIVLTDPRTVPTDDRCPRCRKGPEFRVASAGFGTPHAVCRNCGYEWPDEECSQ